MATETTLKTSWADDVDELDQVPKVPGIISDTVDENGIRTIVEYTINDEGKKVKVTRRIKRTLQKQLVNHTVAERKHWEKFGQEKGNKPGPDRATTTVGENVTLKLSVGNKSNEPEPSQEQQIKNSLANKKISCRLCKGDHFTSKCPYKDTLGMLDGAETPPVGDDDAPAPAADMPAVGSTSGKYVPPSMRAGAGAGRGAGESMFRSREDLPTLRVTNVSEDTTDNDLRDLFSNFGRVARVYIGRDRDTGIGKGYAFVSFEDRAVAQRAMEKVHGMGYDNLILNCQWSQPREQRPGGS
ncbi:translation initiation factor eIF3g [Ramaria rubella]|nr:translation initiation factor eIF3g [Ramaria rubella]